MLTIVQGREVALLGSYRGHWTTGTVAAGAAANSLWFSFRWGNDTGKLAVPRRVRVGLDALTAFTAGLAKIDLVVARAFTVANTGGTASVPAANNNELRTTFSAALVSDLRISSTAALAGGTQTLDAVPMAHVNFSCNTTANSTQLQSFEIYSPLSDQTPIILAQDEGFVLRATVPATGTWNGHVTIQWDEVDAFQ